MAWVTFDAAYLSRRMLPEWQPLKDRINMIPGVAFDAVVSDVIANVVARVRGSVAACQATRTLGADGTIPPELAGAAVSLCRIELISTVPGAVSLADETRKELLRDARAQLDAAAACKIAITPPDTAPTTPTAPAAQGKWGGDSGLLWGSTPTMEGPQ